MIVRLPNKKNYELNTNLSYEERCSFVDKILEDCLDEIDIYWENNKTMILLDILGNYLFNGQSQAEKQEEYSILNHDQLKYKKFKQSDLPIDATFVENKKPKTKSAIKQYKNSITHKLTTLKIPLEQRKNRKIPIENSITTHRITIEDNKIKYENDIKYREIDVFTNEDLKLPYINPSLPYLYKWALVNIDNEFIFDNKKHKIDLEYYPFDMVLCYYQDGKYYYFDPKVEVLNEYIKSYI